MRTKRAHGRILSVETLTRGSALAEDAAAGATSITVVDAGDFEETDDAGPTPTATDPLGWLTLNGQVVAYLACDDDTGIIGLADPLTAAAEEGDTVAVWSDLYEEPIEYQQALVELEGRYDNPEPVEAEVAEGVDDLPEGDRGKPGESCTLKRLSDDEWEVVAVGGRSRRSRGTRYEQDDYYTLTAADIAAGTATLPLSRRPNNEALTCVLAGAPQRPTEWSVDYDAQTLTISLSGWEQAGDVLWVHYAYRKGVATAVIPPTTVYLALGDTVTALNGGLLGGDQATIVGTGAIWKDDSDATYADIVTQMHGAGQPQFTSSATVSVTTTASVPRGSTIFVRLRVSAVSADMPYPDAVLYRDVNNRLDGRIDGTCPTTPTWVEYAMSGTSQNLFLDAPSTFGLNVNSPTKSGGNGDQHWRIYEAQLYVQEA